MNFGNSTRLCETKEFGADEKNQAARIAETPISRSGESWVNRLIRARNISVADELGKEKQTWSLLEISHPKKKCGR